MYVAWLFKQMPHKNPHKVSVHFGFSTRNIQPNDYANKIGIHQMMFSLLAYLFGINIYC